LRHLKELKLLRSLTLTYSTVSDAELVYLQVLTNLRVLELVSNRKITGIGFQHLAGSKLESLNCDSTSMTDEGLAYVKQLTQLKTLNLGSTNVSDAGLKHLAGLSKLDHLTLQRTSVTAAGVAELQKALPNCRIQWDGM